MAAKKWAYDFKSKTWSEFVEKPRRTRRKAAKAETKEVKAENK